MTAVTSATDAADREADSNFSEKAVEMDASSELDVSSEIDALAGSNNNTLLALRELRQILGEQEELRALGALKHRAWRRDVETRIELAIQSLPDDPGPLNPQMLFVRSITAMGERSPAYLRRLVTYLTSLVWLEEQGG